jgi:hypothetical protein
MEAGLANTPRWLAAAAGLALMLFGSIASEFRSSGAASSGDAAWRTLPERAMQIASAIESRGGRDAESMSAWLDEVRRESKGEIEWVRLLDSAGATEARSGAVVARVRWNEDARIQSGQRSYRVVETGAGLVAVAAAPLTVQPRKRDRLVRLASWGGASSEVKLLEMGAPIQSGASGTAKRSQWIDLIGSGCLAALLLAALVRRALLLD